MTLSLRRRSALVLAGVVATAPLWLAVAAHAADQVVTFHGTPDFTASTVSCPSTPDRPTLQVNPGETVDFVNQLGVGATLTSSTGHQNLGNGQMVPVTFAASSAPILIEMLPHCPLDVGVHDVLSVTVLAPAPDPSTSASASASVPAAGPAPSASPGRSHSPTPTQPPDRQNTRRSIGLRRAGRRWSPARAMAAMRTRLVRRPIPSRPAPCTSATRSARRRRPAAPVGCSR